MDEQINDNKRGRLFADRYLLVECIGEGGMGEVYLAKDTMLDGEEVAIKILHKDLATDEAHSRRFLREVQLARKVTHENIVRVYDTGSHEGRLFITMEYADGVTLRDKLREGSIDVDAWFEVLPFILDGLQAIHNIGIIHRDIKPANIILTVDGEIKITDFGVARPKDSTFTRHNEVVGSAAYLAPEAWAGTNIGMPSDIYSLGVVTYEMLAGVLPFQASAPAEMMCKHLEEAYIPLRQHCDIPPSLEAVVDKMLEKDPANRFKSARDLKAAIFEAEGKTGGDSAAGVKAKSKRSILQRLLREPESEPEVLAANNQALQPDKIISGSIPRASGSYEIENTAVPVPFLSRALTFARGILVSAGVLISAWFVLNYAVAPLVKSMKISYVSSPDDFSLFVIVCLSLILTALYFSLPLICISSFASSLNKSIRGLFKTYCFSLSAVFLMFAVNFALLLYTSSTIGIGDKALEETHQATVREYLLSSLPATAYTSLHAAALSPSGSVYKSQISYGIPVLVKMKPELKVFNYYTGVVFAYLLFILYLVYSEFWPGRVFRGFFILAAVPAVGIWVGCTFFELLPESWAWLKLGVRMGLADYNLTLMDLAASIGVVSYLCVVSTLLPRSKE